MTKHTLIVLPFLALAACNGANSGSSANAAPAGNASEDMTASPVQASPNVTQASANSAPTDAATYLAKAGAGDLFEIESSKAIMEKTENAEVNSFAKMMVDEHGKSTAKLKAAAQAAKLPTSPPTLEPKQQQAVDSIRAAQGDAADRLYLDAQRMAHSDALALHRGYASGGDTAQLKATAASIAPVVQHHIDMLAKIKS